MTLVYPNVKKAATLTRDPELRAKLLCLLRGLRKGDTVADACEPFGVSRRTFYRWLHRLMEGNFDPLVLLPRSRRPLNPARQIEGDLQDRILKMRTEFRYGPARIAWYLVHWGFSVSANGVYKVLRRAGVVMGRHRTKRKNPHTRRYELDRPGQGFQIDIKYVPFPIEEKRGFVFSAIDDCTRWRFSAAYRELGYNPAVDFVRRLVAACPFSIESIQTDNDICFTDRFLAKSPDYSLEHPFDQLLRTLDILHKLIPPGIKELNGKVERSFKTDMDEFFWKIPENISWSRFQVELDRWTYAYNHHRPHSSLKMRTPIERLGDFGIQPRTTQRALIQLDQLPRIPLALHFSKKLQKLGKPDTWFHHQLPEIKPKRRRSADLATLFSQPTEIPLCHFCGDTTVPFRTQEQDAPERLFKFNYCYCRHLHFRCLPRVQHGTHVSAVDWFASRPLRQGPDSQG